MKYKEFKKTCKICKCEMQVNVDMIDKISDIEFICHKCREVKNDTLFKK